MPYMQSADKGLDSGERRFTNVLWRRAQTTASLAHSRHTTAHAATVTVDDASTSNSPAPRQPAYGHTEHKWREHGRLQHSHRLFVAFLLLVFHQLGQQGADIPDAVANGQLLRKEIDTI